MAVLRDSPQRAGSAAHQTTLASPARCTIRTAIPACRTGSEVPQPRAPSSLRPNRIGAVGAGSAESSFDARRAAPLLLSQVAAPHALRRLRHGYTGCASVRSVCQRNGCAKVVMRCLENRRRELSEASILRSLLAMCMMAGRRACAAATAPREACRVQTPGFGGGSSSLPHRALATLEAGACRRGGELVSVVSICAASYSSL